jgi:glycosyltransferase involved in cell wall biosynthesis
MTMTPLVSVVTPFYNTVDYLRECIESVLGQTYSSFEYLLVDNQSTDGSARIAAEYAAKDSRIRVIRNREFVGQVRNYNGALLHVAPEARYVKIVQADDFILPECLERMVAVGEAHPTAAIIGSYFLMGEELAGSGIEWPAECIPGRTAARLQLLENRFIFGSPTNVLYRADLLAKRQPFFDETSLHDDTDLCYEVLADADMGFVHQVLSFMRVGNSGVLTSIDSFHWRLLDLYMVLRKFGPRFLSPEELEGRITPVRTEYLRLLGEGALLAREPEFWNYHRRGLATVGEELPSTIALGPHVARAALKAVVKPKWLLRERSRLRKSTGAGKLSD